MGKFYFLVLFIVCSSFVALGRTKGTTYGQSTLLFHHAIQSNLTAHSSDTDTVVVHHRKHKLIAALLAFPLGIFGLHRLYLGTSGGVPFLYIASFGGLFGILPFVDFIQILLCKDVNAYAHKSTIFMWSKKKKQ